MGNPAGVVLGVWVWVERREGEYHVRVGGTGCFVREMAIDVRHD